MRVLLSPYFNALLWGFYAAVKAYANWSQLFPPLLIFQNSFILPFWQIWVIVSLLCLFGALPFERLRRHTSFSRIAGITLAAFVLMVKTLLFFAGVGGAFWGTGANYFMLSMGALGAATYFGRERGLIHPEEIAEIEDKLVSLAGVEPDREGEADGDND